MPTYDYECSACKHAFEQYQSFSEDKLIKCPKCKKKKLERLIGIGVHCHVENVTTVGQLGERNARKLGSAGLDDFKEKNKEVIENKKEIKKNRQILKDPKKYIEDGKI